MNKITNKQFGFTLVELLVALLIGLLLSAAIITIYAGSQSTFRASQGVSRSQEATRFAVHFLKTDIRQAGFNGCSEGVSKRSTLNQFDANHLPAYETAIFGWDYAGTDTPGDTFDLDYETSPAGASDADVQTNRTANTDGAAMWQGQTVQLTQDPTRGTIASNQVVNLPPIIQALEPLLGSDIVSVTKADPLLSNDSPVYITTQTNERSPTLQTEDSDGNAIDTGVGTGGIITVGDCSSVDTFQNTAAAGDSFFSASPNGGGAISPDNNLTGAFGWQKKWDENAQVYQQTALVYFVGTGASGSPSLYRYSSNCGLVAPAAAGANCRASVVELVEGVENIQAKYAEDINGDGVPDRLLSANQVTDFDNVLSVELGILVRSVDSGLEVDNTGTYILAGDTTINPPNDRFQRFVSNTSIRLHNRGL